MTASKSPDRPPADRPREEPRTPASHTASLSFAGTALLEPGARVRHPQHPEWGAGQVQSVVGARVTANFEHAGKVLVNAAVVTLEPLVD